MFLFCVSKHGTRRMSEYTCTQRCLCMQHVLFDSIQLPHQSGIVGHNETATLRLNGHQLSRQLDITSTASVRHANNRFGETYRIPNNENANNFVSPFWLVWRSRALSGYLGKQVFDQNVHAPLLLTPLAAFQSL